MTSTVKAFFHTHRERLSSWHPGLSERVLVDELGSMPEHELGQAQQQLLEGVPLAYITRSRFFYRAEFTVDERVFIPRMESELIIELLGKKWRSGHRILVDVGTGSGCLGLTCAMTFPSLRRVVLTDLSARALEVASINLERLGASIPSPCQVALQHGPCLEGIPPGDIVIANPPYIKSSQGQQVHPQVYRYEPHIALFIADEDYEKLVSNFFSAGG